MQINVFVDTNVLVSAILFPGSVPDKALQKSFKDPYKCFTSNYCLNELDYVFRTKFPHKLTTLTNTLNVYLMYMNIFDESEIIFNEELQIRDTNDRKVIRAALESDCIYLITGDKDLLETEINSINIVNPSKFLYDC